MGKRPRQRRDQAAFKIDIPECKKLEDSQDQRIAIESFLDYLERQGMALFKWHDKKLICEITENVCDNKKLFHECPKHHHSDDTCYNYPADDFYRFNYNREALLFEFLGIDANKLEQERRSILEMARVSQGMTASGGSRS